MHLSAPFVAALSLCACVAAVPRLSARDKSKAAKLSTRSSILDGSIHVSDVISHWLQNMKRQDDVDVNVTVPQFLIQNVIAQGEAVQGLYFTVEPLLPKDTQALFPEVIVPFNKTLIELESYANSTSISLGARNV